jgi:hypothetical protein
VRQRRKILLSNSFAIQQNTDKRKKSEGGNYPLTLEVSLEVLADAKKLIKKLEKNAGRGCM